MPAHRLAQLSIIVLASVGVSLSSPAYFSSVIPPPLARGDFRYREMA